jgi:phage baseplate assembly protein W
MAIPHFSIPFKFNGSVANVTEQDSIEEIEDCIETIIRFPIGQRPEKPDFGISDQTFATPEPDITLIAAAISEWEPRANPLIYEPIIDDLISKIIVEVDN